MAQVTLKATAARKDAQGKTTITVTLNNPTEYVALMTHIQLHRKDGERVLPAFASENYVSLAPGETRELSIVADTKLLHGEEALVAVDGWNVDVAPAKSLGVAVELNTNAQVSHWPVTYLPYQKEALR
jgi:beta-mannosidase